MCQYKRKASGLKADRVSWGSEPSSGGHLIESYKTSGFTPDMIVWLEEEEGNFPSTRSQVSSPFAVSLSST